MPPGPLLSCPGSSEHEPIECANPHSPDRKRRCSVRLLRLRQSPRFFHNMAVLNPNRRVFRFTAKGGTVVGSRKLPLPRVTGAIGESDNTGLRSIAREQRDAWTFEPLPMALHQQITTLVSRCHSEFGLQTPLLSPGLRRGWRTARSSRSLQPLLSVSDQRGPRCRPECGWN
jgi:hypothetical protein